CNTVEPAGRPRDGYTPHLGGLSAPSATVPIGEIVETQYRGGAGAPGPRAESAFRRVAPDRPPPGTAERVTGGLAKVCDPRRIGLVQDENRRRIVNGGT